MTLVNPLDMQTVYRPRTLAEALVYLRQGKTIPYPLAGGTGLLAGPARGVEAVVDLSLLGLDSITDDEVGLHIGAMATLQALVETPLVAQWADELLRNAAHAAAPSVQRHQRTVGGTVISGSDNDDLLVALLALEAQVVCYFPGERDIAHTYPLAEFLNTVRARRPYLLTEIRIPAPARGVRARLLRVARSPRSAAIVNVALTLSLDDQGQIQGTTIAVGGIADAPIRLDQVEQALVGRPPQNVHDADVEKWVRDQVPARDDWMASAAYRRHVVGVLVRRALRACAAS